MMLADGLVCSPVGPARHSLENAFADETRQVLAVDRNLASRHEESLLRVRERPFPR
jgi:hypothetical protein